MIVNSIDVGVLIDDIWLIPVTQALHHISYQITSLFISHAFRFCRID